MYQQYEYENQCVARTHTPDSEGFASSTSVSPSPYDYYYQSKSFNDSNYYSRNDSMYYPNESLNESYAKPVKQTEKKPFLKFSIEAILGLNSQEKPQLIESPVEEIVDEVKSKGKKRKSRKSSDNSAANNKRMRTIFTQEQLDKLEEEFLRQQYMVGSERSYLANSLGLSESQVKIWFQNRRIKWRKTQSGDNKNDDEVLNQSCSNDSLADE